MLVISRRTGEFIILQDPQSGRIIELVVVAVKGERVQLGLKADNAIRIIRKELLDEGKNHG